MTTRQVISLLRKNKIRFTICEEIIPFKVFGDKTQSNIELVMKKIRSNVENQLKDLDRSFALYEKAAYQSMEYLRRDRSSGRRPSLITHLESFSKGESDFGQHLPSAKINNLR